MRGGRNAIDADDDVSKLMPNMAKLIRSGESDSLVRCFHIFLNCDRLYITTCWSDALIICLQESKGSTSMSFSENSAEEDIERQNVKPSRQRRRESVFRDVANKFLRRGAGGTRASKSSALATLSSNCRWTNPVLTTPSKFRIDLLPIATYWQTYFSVLAMIWLRYLIMKRGCSAILQLFCPVLTDVFHSLCFVIDCLYLHYHNLTCWSEVWRVELVVRLRKDWGMRICSRRKTWGQNRQYWFNKAHDRYSSRKWP